MISYSNASSNGVSIDFIMEFPLEFPERPTFPASPDGSTLEELASFSFPELAPNLKSSFG